MKALLYALLTSFLVISSGNLLAVSQFVTGWERIIYGFGSLLAMCLAFFPGMKLYQLLENK